MRETILVVDDQPSNLWFVSKVLQALGYGTLTALNGLEAMRFLEDCGKRIQLVLLDTEMPGMDGVAFLQRLRKQQPDIPVIIVSRQGEDEPGCRRLGVREFIRKPYSLEDLHKSIESAFGRAMAAEAKADLAAGVVPSAKVLIVDDEADVGRSIAEALMEDFTDADFNIRWVGSGDEALSMSKEFSPDIAVIDIKMPGMSGDELIRRFKAGEGNCPRDFVIYTGVADPQIIERIQTLGHKVVTKPMNLETLFAVLTKICIRHHLLSKRS